MDYNELQQHGTEDFPFAFYQIDEHHPRYNMPFHWHREIELILIYEGAFDLFLDEKEVWAKAGDLLLIEGGIIHGGIPQNCIYSCIVFDFQRLLMHTDACKQYLRPLKEHRIRLRQHFTKGDALCSAALPLFESAGERRPGWELTVLGGLFSLFGTIFEQKQYTSDGLSAKSVYKTELLRPVLEFIETHYESPITLDTLSRIAGMSPKYFCRFFHSFIHRTPIDYLNYYRIERACFLFGTTELSVTEVAYRCGFSDSNYFARIFRKYKQMTPKQYQMGNPDPMH